MSRQAFEALCDEHIEESFRLDPVYATLNGVHDFDSELGDPSLGAVRRRIEWLGDQLRRAESEVEVRDLEPHERIDHRLLISRLKAGLLVWERQREAERNPILYPDQCMYGVFLLFTREFAPFAERLVTLQKRLSRIPAYLRAARETVGECPTLFAQTAAEVADSAVSFLDEVRSEIGRREPQAAANLGPPCDAAQGAFREYAAWARDKASQGSKETFAVGRDIFDARLRDEHLLAFDTRALERHGWELLRATQARMEEVARTIHPQKSWRTLVEESKEDVPGEVEILDVYRKEVERARRFLVDKRLTPFPPGEILEIVATPAFDRSRTPYAAYLMPGPFDSVQRGLFYVTCVDPTDSPEARRATLLGHNLHSVPIITAHEAYPGHHLQLCWANRARTRLRKLADSPVLAEGWGLYCEELMYEQGFFPDARSRLFQLKDACWRAARVVLDCRLHTGEIEFGGAVDFLVEEAGLERPNAESEVRRYATSPTQPMSYAVGKQALLDLRGEVQKQLGDAFDLHDFHGAVLQAGTLPVGLVRDEVVEKFHAGSH